MVFKYVRDNLWSGRYKIGRAEMRAGDRASQGFSLTDERRSLKKVGEHYDYLAIRFNGITLDMDISGF
jgi:hypothetical protein